jgi:hypothetical protein
MLWHVFGIYTANVGAVVRGIVLVLMKLLLLHWKLVVLPAILEFQLIGTFFFFSHQSIVLILVEQHFRFVLLEHIFASQVSDSLTLISPLADVTATEMPSIGLSELPFFMEPTSNQSNCAINKNLV